MTIPDPRHGLDADQLGAYFALIEAGDRLQRAVADQLAEHGLTHLQFSLLARLHDASTQAPDASLGGLRMNELADALVVSRSGLTYQLTQLEKTGLAERTTTPDDDRGVVARITPAGSTRIVETMPGHVALVKQYLFDVVTPDEIETMRTALGRVVEHLRPERRA
jgi:DNA-binding MarR family transcriptional regulator